MNSESSYWDNLDWIARTAEMLKRHSIPETHHECQALQERLADAQFAMRRMMSLVSGSGELWGGEKDDLLRGGRVLASEWDGLIEQYNNRP